MTKATKQALNTVMAIHIDRLTVIMDMLGTKQAMREAITARSVDMLTAIQAASRHKVSREGVSRTENRIVQFDKRLDDIYKG